jgi:large subunit ribosomal protein L30
MAVKKKSDYPLIKITLKKSVIGRTQKQRAIVKGLGLRRIDSSVVREKRPEILGMVKKIDFLVDVEEVTS